MGRKILLMLAGAVALAGCSPQQEATIAADASVATQIAGAIDPADLAKIQAFCPIVTDGLVSIAAKATGGAVAQVSGLQSIAAGSCTPSGQTQLAANDAAPVTATNSGNSPSFLLSLLDGAADAVKIGLAVAPLL